MLNVMVHEINKHDNIIVVFFVDVCSFVELA